MVGRYSKSRKKSCRACASTKSRCDRNPTGCGRCASRQLTCIYSTDSIADSHDQEPNDTIDAWSHEESSNSLVSNLFNATPSTSHASASETGNHFSNGSYDRQIDVPEARPEASLNIQQVLDLELVCPIDAENIKNRWLNSYVPIPGQVTKTFPSNVAIFVYNILKSYTSALVRGRSLPPFLHPLQTSRDFLCPAISTCLSLIRVCESPLPGSERVAVDILRREMEVTYCQFSSLHGLDVLAAFQAYLIYCMTLYFQLGVHPDSFLRQDIMNLQEIACFCAQKGLVCQAEQAGIRPRWETWIIAESKRRTLYTMYLFDNVLSIKDGLPTFLATEVRGLPAPSGKSLWGAQSRDGWEKAFNLQLADWTDGYYRIDELWPETAEDDATRTKRQRRSERWLETVDEYGTMMYAVTSCVHGE